MRVLFISERYPPYLTGGYEVACAAVAEGLRRLGHEVRVLTSDFGLNGTRPDEPHVDRHLHYKQNATSLRELARWETAVRPFPPSSPEPPRQQGHPVTSWSRTSTVRRTVVGRAPLDIRRLTRPL